MYNTAAAPARKKGAFHVKYNGTETNREIVEDTVCVVTHNVYCCNCCVLLERSRFNVLLVRKSMEKTNSIRSATLNYPLEGNQMK